MITNNYCDETNNLLVSSQSLGEGGVSGTPRYYTLDTRMERPHGEEQETIKHLVRSGFTKSYLHNVQVQGSVQYLQISTTGKSLRWQLLAEKVQRMIPDHDLA